MGFKYENQHLFHKCLRMGASISCSLLEQFLIALHWFVQQESNNDNTLHYLCDLLFGGKAETKQSSNCKLWGSIYQMKRLFNQQRSRCFGDIELDTNNMVIRK